MQQLLWITGLATAINVNGQLARPQQEDTASAKADITQATVYFGYGAELTHQAKVKVNTATKTIIIDQLSTNLDINSLQISCPEEVALLSHRYKVFYPVEPVLLKNKDVERLEDSIGLVQKEISRVDNLIAIDQEILTKTSVLIEAALNGNGGKTMASGEVLKLVEYYNAKIEKFKTSIYSHQQSNKQLYNWIDEIKKRIAAMNIIAPAKPKPYGQLILQVLCKSTGEIPVSLSYYTQNAGWTPVYDIRVKSKTNKVKLVYKASLTQATGIDSKKTKMTLSTGTPNFGVAAPVLSPWYLQLYVPELYKALQNRAAGVNVNRNTIQSFNDDKASSEVVITGYNGQYQEEKPEKTIEAGTLQQYTTLNEGQLNTSFEIDLPYDIESDGQLHSVSIRDEEIICTLKNYAAPRVDKEAYLMAEVADWQNLDLLPGDANVIMDDTYIGKSIIDPNTTADTLNLSLGKDKRLAIKRSLVKELSSLKTSGGSNRQNFTCEIIVKNNKLTDVNL